jgi:hypothetical protein
MHNNFCRIHKTLHMTPAIAAGVTDRVWDYVHRSWGVFMPKIKPTPEENRRLLLAILFNSLGVVTIVFSVLLFGLKHADWFYIGLGIGIAICMLGSIRIVAVARQINRAHQNEEVN